MSKKSFTDKLKYINAITEKLDGTFSSLSIELYKTIINNFVDKLEKDGQTIANTPNNLKLIAAIETIYNKFATQQMPAVASEINTGATGISEYNVDYFSEFAGDRNYQATTQRVQRVIRDRLGITADTNGKRVNLKEGGYMDSLLKDNTIKNELKTLSYREVANGIGFQAFKKGLEKFIVGDKESIGGFRQFYRNYAYDIYTEIDAQESVLLAKELDLQYFFYEGTIIESSRDFCRKRAGKLFSTEEAAEWIKDPWIKKNFEKGYILSYNPLTDRGLFGCRHVPRFVSKEVAWALRPELKKNA